MICTSNGWRVEISPFAIIRIDRSLRWAARDLRRILFVSFTIFTSLAAHHENMAISYQPTFNYATASQSSPERLFRKRHFPDAIARSRSCTIRPPEFMNFVRGSAAFEVIRVSESKDRGQMKSFFLIGSASLLILTIPVASAQQHATAAAAEEKIKGIADQESAGPQGTNFLSL